MELDTVKQLAAVLDAHDRTIRQSGGDGEFGTQGALVDGEGMVAGHFEGILQASEDTGSTMSDGLHDPMDGIAFEEAAAVEVVDALMTQTDAQDGNPAGIALQDLKGIPGVFRPSRPRGDDDVGYILEVQFKDRIVVVLIYLDNRSEDFEILVNVVSE